jgi:hypothetical protein
MTRYRKLVSYFSGTVATALLGAASLTPAAAAPCTGPGAPTTTQTKCLTAVAIPGNALRSFDISWVNPHRAEYYLGDRSNKGIDVIDTQTLKFKRTIGGFIGIVLNSKGAVDNNHSGPDGVVSHGRWLYAGDGNSTLKVIDLDNLATPIQQILPTGGTTRVDEMALTTDGRLLIAANNAEDPPFATLFAANGDDPVSHVTNIAKVVIDPASGLIIPNAGQSLEQPAWDPTTKRFYTSVPAVATNPPGCDPSANPAGPNACDGGLLVFDPARPTLKLGVFDPATGTGVILLHGCGPNGAALGPHDNILLGCTPGNNATNVATTVINATTHNYASVANITGSDEVWFNKGDNRYYLGASKAGLADTPPTNRAVLGVVDDTSVLIETIPQSTGSHSVAADSKRNLIFVPQVAPASVVGSGGETAQNGVLVGVGICGGSSGCIAVYKHDVDEDDDDHDN